MQAEAYNPSACRTLMTSSRTGSAVRASEPETYRDVSAKAFKKESWLLAGICNGHHKAAVSCYEL